MIREFVDMNFTRGKPDRCGRHVRPDLDLDFGRSLCKPHDVDVCAKEGVWGMGGVGVRVGVRVGRGDDGMELLGYEREGERELVNTTTSH